MKTSSKLTAAMLTTLVVGGSSAGSLFSSVLNEGSSSSIGTAGALFSTLDLPETSASIAPVLEPLAEEPDVVVAEAKPTKAPSKESKDSVTKIRTITQEPVLEVSPEASPTPEISAVPEPTETPLPESSATPDSQVAPTSIPTPEPTASLLVEEPTPIEP